MFGGAFMRPEWGKDGSGQSPSERLFKLRLKATSAITASYYSRAFSGRFEAELRCTDTGLVARRLRNIQASFASDFGDYGAGVMSAVVVGCVSVYWAASAPMRVSPLTVTSLFVPTSASENAPATADASTSTSSPLTTPTSAAPTRLRVAT